jgi:hypothetical protein
MAWPLQAHQLLWRLQAGQLLCMLAIMLLVQQALAALLAGQVQQQRWNFSRCGGTTQPQSQQGKWW